MNRNVLVLGGSGFFGSAICNTLASSDTFEVYLGDINPKSFPKVHKIKVDILDYKNVEHAFQGKDIVINCTGQVTQPVDTCLKLNSTGVINIAKACNKNNNYLIQVSSVNVYGTSTFVTDEDSRVNPETPYAASKAIAEFLLTQLTQPERLSVLRISNIFGQGQEKGIVSYLLQTFRNQEKLRFNNDGSLTRYYIHIADAVEIIKLFIQSGPTPGTFNIKGPDRLSIMELTDIFYEITNKTKHLEFSQVPSMENILNLDDTKIRKIIPIKFNHDIRSFLHNMVNQ